MNKFSQFVRPNSWVGQTGVRRLPAVVFCVCFSFKVIVLVDLSFAADTIVIGPQDSDWHSLSTAAGQTYTVHFDFSTHNYDSDGGEQTGWRQNYDVNWGPTTSRYLFEVGSKQNPVLTPGSSITFVAPGDGIDVRVVDTNYWDNTGNVTVILESGPPSLHGGNSVSIGPTDSDWHSLPTTAGERYTVFFNFSAHNYDSNGGERDGWRQNYDVNWGPETSRYLFEVGTKANPVYTPQSSITFIAPEEKIDVRVVDTNYWDNTGDVIVTLANIPTQVSTDDKLAPDSFELYQNYPNPFNPTTTVAYSLSEPSLVEVAVFDMLGQKVRTLSNCLQIPGLYSVEWNGRNENGTRVGSGVYLCQLKAGNLVRSRTMLLVK